MLRVVTPPTASAIVQLATVKARFGQATTAAQDAILADLIGEVGSAFAGILGFDIPRRRIREDIAGYGDGRLIVTCRPVEGLAEVAVKLDGQSISGAFAEDEFAGILAIEGGTEWTARAFSGVDLTPVAGAEQLRYEATYWAGYLLPGEGLRAASDVPVQHLALSGAHAAGAGTLSLVAGATLTGTLPAGSGLAIDGDDTIYVTQAAATAAANALSVTVLPVLAASAATGTSVQASPHYLPESVEGLAVRAVLDLYRRRGFPGGLTSLSAAGFSASFSELGDSGLPREIEAALRRAIG